MSETCCVRSCWQATAAQQQQHTIIELHCASAYYPKIHLVRGHADASKATLRLCALIAKTKQADKICGFCRTWLVTATSTNASCQKVQSQGMIHDRHPSTLNILSMLSWLCPTSTNYRQHTQRVHYTRVQGLHFLAGNLNASVLR